MGLRVITCCTNQMLLHYAMAEAVLYFEVLLICDILFIFSIGQLQNVL
jgi:hypothetical protein